MKAKTHKPLPTPLIVNRIYSKIALVFIVISFILILIIFYFAFSRVTITIIPLTTPAQTTFSIDVTNTSGNDELNARIVEKEITKKQEFTVQPSPAISGPAEGTIKIVSHYSKEQPLVATTRFQTKNGLVFRAIERVIVPPYGEATVRVRADGTEEKYVIEANQSFVIPGLNPTLQTMFDSTNSEKFTAPSKDVTIIKQTDIDNALSEIKKIVTDEALKDFSAETKAGEEVFQSNITVEIIDYTSDQKINTNIPQFTIDAKTKAVALLFNKEKLLNTATTQLKQSVPNTRELIAIDKESFSYSIKSYDPKKQLMTVEVSVNGKTIGRTNNSVFDKTAIRGKNKSQIENYFKSFPDIQSVSIDFSPSWIPIVPQLDDHITITLIEKEVSIAKPKE